MLLVLNIEVFKVTLIQAFLFGIALENTELNITEIQFLFIC